MNMIKLEHPNSEAIKKEVIEWLKPRLESFDIETFFHMWVNGVARVFVKRKDSIVGMEVWICLLNPLNPPFSHAYLAKSIGEMEGIKEYRQIVFQSTQVIES